MKVFVIAGEPSGDLLGAALIDGLRREVPDLTLRGVAGPRMIEAGMRSLFPMEELSVMGIAEILPKYRALMRRIDQTARAVIDLGPDVLVTIDSPDFSLRVAKRVKAASRIRCVHYVAPTVWAWRPGRAQKMAAHIDHVLALFPFEPPYMEAAGMACDFVGHPIATVRRPTPQEVETAKAANGLHGDPIVTLLPGSRRSEVERLMPIFVEALRRWGRAAHIVIPTLPQLKPIVEAQAKRLPVAASIVVDGGSEGPTHRMAMSLGDVALAASGTVSLDLAAARTPMVVAYDMNWMSRRLIARMLKIDTVTLVNLVSETRSVPELLGDACRPAAIAKALDRVLAAPAAQLSAMGTTMERLGAGGPDPGHRAARAILSRL
ncbi:MAG: lipid-A-disaccharide synthase [Shimia sp.]